MIRPALALLAATPALADPVFMDRAATLPAPHVYSGGWAHFVGGGVALMDCDGDTRPDLFAAGGETPALLARNVTPPGGDIAFDPLPLEPLVAVTGAYPLDLNGDTHIDLFVLRNGANRALLGNGDCTFTDGTAALGLPQDDAWTTAFSATWEDGQSLPTLAIGNYVDADDPDGPFGTCDDSWLIRPDGPRYAPPEKIAPSFCTLSMLISDWRRDGTPLLRMSNDRHYHIGKGREQMWDLSPLREWNLDDDWPRLRLWGMGIASADITGDGLPEVVLTSMGDQLIQTNDGTRFTALPYEIGTYAARPYASDDGRPSTGWHAEFADFDNDTRLDLFIAKGNVDQMPGLAMADPNNLLMQQPDGSFSEVGDTSGIGTPHRARGASIADLNGDGALDLVVVNRRAPLEIWQNATADIGTWLQVDLRQGGGNTRAAGAFIEAKTEDTLQTREITVGGGHASGSAVPAHFGLDDAMHAELRVVWPDGVVSDWQSHRANQIVVLTRD